MDYNICITRDYIKKILFPIIFRELDNFLDYEKISLNEKKLFLPIKKDVDKNHLQKKSVDLRVKLKKFLESNTEIQKNVKQKFANNLGVNEDDVEISPWVPFDSRLNVPVDYIPNKNKKIAGALGWHQDTGSWYNLDLQKNMNEFIEKNYWKRITYSNWIPLTDCNSKNGVQLIENSDIFGLQNVKEKSVGLFSNRYYFQESIKTKDINNLKKINLTPKAGVCNYFNSLVFHRSMINTSDEIRCSFEMRFSLKKIEYAKTISKKILLKRFIFQNYPNLYNITFLPKYIINKVIK